jgi:alanine racemase
VTVAGHATAVLTVDLDALASNYELIRVSVDGATVVSAVVKADGYGLGAIPTAIRLAKSGCQNFFVATLDEGISLRPAVPDASIYVLAGPEPDTTGDFRAANLTPVLNRHDQVQIWRDAAWVAGELLPAVLHLDTGMSRIGFEASEFEAMIEDPIWSQGIELSMVMSHLAVADDPDDAMNEQQRATFDQLREKLPALPASLANSAGIQLGRQFHYQMVRPGIALYGGNPLNQGPNKFSQVFTIQSKIIQIRQIDLPRTVGYGATHRVTGPSRIATVPVGYADGYLRSLSNRGTVSVDGHLVPVVGRVSMDLITIDVSALPESATQPGTSVHLLGNGVTLDDLAAAAGTISYELLTRFGPRMTREYLTRSAE